MSDTRAPFFSGILLIVLFACTATYIAGFEAVRSLRLSPLIVGIPRDDLCQHPAAAGAG